MANFAFTNLTECPPGGFRYFVPETKTWFNHLSLDDLKRALQAHYKANQLPCPGNLGELIADQLCPDLPPDKCVRLNPNVALHLPAGGNMTVNDVVAGTKNMLAFIAGGGEKVAPEEADRRALICSRCSWNRTPTGCRQCNSPLKALATAIVRPRPTAHDAHLNSCRICKCLLKLKVWFPLATLLANMPQQQKEQLPDFCWLRSPQT